MAKRPIWVCNDINDTIFEQILLALNAQEIIIDNKAECWGSNSNRQLPNLFDKLFKRADEKGIKVVMSVYNCTCMTHFGAKRFFISPDTISYTEQLKIARGMIDSKGMDYTSNENKNNTQFLEVLNKNYCLNNENGDLAGNSDERWRELLQVLTDETQKYDKELLKCTRVSAITDLGTELSPYQNYRLPKGYRDRWMS